MGDALIADLQPRVDDERPRLQPVPAAQPAVFEYRVIYVARSMAGQPNEGVESDLNKAALDGWRLAGSLTNDEARTTGLILERRQATASPQE